MNYQKIYNQIIERAQTRKLEGYVERHHIIPKCIGGLDVKENIVELTAREHFLCHRLLCEIYPNHPRLWYALWLMTIGKRKWTKQKPQNLSSREYEYVKEKFSELASLRKPNLGNKHTIKTKNKMSKSHKGKKRNKECIQKMKESALGKIKSDIHKHNLSISCSKSFGKPVIQYDINGNFIKEWETGKLASKELNINYTAINNCCRRNKNKKIKNNSSHNYIWAYKILDIL
jgi:hypothetical protein